MDPSSSDTQVDERIVVWVKGRGEAHGADIADGLRIDPETLRTALQRLEGAGVLTARWEGGDPAPDGRPGRRLYRFADTCVATGAPAQTTGVSAEPVGGGDPARSTADIEARARLICLERGEDPDVATMPGMTMPEGWTKPTGPARPWWTFRADEARARVRGD